MKNLFFDNLITRLKLLVVSGFAAFSLLGCGGGSGDSEGPVIAPESLDQVKIDFFGAFTMDCLRLSGTAGNEQGGCNYTRIRSPFRFGISGGVGDSSNLGTDIAIPVVLTNVGYEYVRTGSDTGRVTFTFFNNQVYPYPEATEATPEVGGSLGEKGEMFWGGRSGLATKLEVDILFTEQNGFIGNTTTRIRSYYSYSSTWTAPGPAVERLRTNDFDTTRPTYRTLAGRPLPAGYNPYESITETTPASAVWSSFKERTVYFTGNDGVTRTVAHQSVGGTGPKIPGLVGSPEESGVILVDERSGGDVVTSVEGTYSYQRTGGDKAKMAIQYTRTVAGITSTVNLLYDMDFETLDSGLYLDDKGVSGEFRQELRRPL